MGAKDAGFRALGKRLIDKYRTVESTLVRTPTGYDPMTGTSSGVASSAQVLPSPAFPYDLARIDGDTVRVSDLYCYVSAVDTDAAGVSPIPSSDVLVSLDGFAVVAAMPLESGDQHAAYQLQLRQG